MQLLHSISWRGARLNAAAVTRAAVPACSRHGARPISPVVTAAAVNDTDWALKTAATIQRVCGVSPEGAAEVVSSLAERLPTSAQLDGMMMTKADITAAVKEAFAEEMKGFKSELQLSIESIKTELMLSTESIKTELQLFTESIKTELQLSTESIKSELQLSTESIKSELKPSIKGIKTELKPSIESIKTELKPSIESIKSELQLSTESFKSELQLSIESSKYEQRLTIALLVIALLVGNGSVGAALLACLAKCFT